MSRELEFDGYWEGNACYTCDCGCKQTVKFRFSSQEEANDFNGQKALLKRRGWIFTKVNGAWHDFAGEACRNRYIRNNTF